MEVRGFQGIDNALELQNLNFPNDKNYWIVCCQPQYFQKSQNWCRGRKYHESIHKYEQCFQNMKEGDMVLYYVSSDKENGQSEKVHAFRAAFTSRDYAEKGNNWLHGTFFATTKEQFESIARFATQGAGVWNMEQNDPDPFCVS